MRRAIQHTAVLFATALLAAGVGFIVGDRDPDVIDAASPYFSSYWTSSPQMRRGDIGGLGISGSSFDAAAAAAGNVWDNAPNNVGADSPSYGWAGSGATLVTSCSSANTGEVLLGSAYLNGSTLGTTSRCVSGGTVTRASIRVNANKAWAIGAVSGKYDLQSLLAHESGHGLGWSTHVSSNCTGSTRNTMCASLPSNTTYMRSLESIDKYQIDIAYQ